MILFFTLFKSSNRVKVDLYNMLFQEKEKQILLLEMKMINMTNFSVDILFYTKMAVSMEEDLVWSPVSRHITLTL